MGVLDIVFTTEFNDKVGWYENDGMEGFTEQPIFAGGVSDQPWKTYPVDMDNDGDMDVIAVFLIKEAVWYENNGSQVFTVLDS